MTRDWKQWEGQIVNGTFPLRQYLGGSGHSAVFLTERRGREPQRAAIKLIPADPANTAVQLARWEATAKLSHPHLLRLFETGSCQLDKSVFLYVVMEYAEDNLAQILPHRALTPEEVRDLLEPALDALTFVHGKSLIHGRLKPSNVMAAQDQLKLSSDSLFRTGDPAGSLSPSSKYDAPEVASGNILPASDSWSLGMTLMEALTQRLPAVEGMTEPLPETVPAPFMGIAHCCLRRDPQRRCTVSDIATRLQSSSPASQQPSTVKIPAGSAKWWYVLLVAAVGLVVAALWIGPKLFNSHPGAPSASSVSSPAPALPEAQSVAPKQEPAPAVPTPEPKPSAMRPRRREQDSESRRAFTRACGGSNHRAIRRRLRSGQSAPASGASSVEVSTEHNFWHHQDQPEGGGGCWGQCAAGDVSNRRAEQVFRPPSHASRAAVEVCPAASERTGGGKRLGGALRLQEIRDRSRLRTGETLTP